MVEIELCKALRALVAEAVKDFRVPVEHGEARAPSVINGYLPPKRKGPGDDFPFVIVRPTSGNTEAGETTISAALVIGCYSESCDGYEYCMNIMSRIRNALCTLPGEVLARKYQLDRPVEWSLSEDQPYPQWQIDMTTNWKYRAPEYPFGLDIEEV